MCSTPPPPQVWPVGHAGHSSWPPQPSPTVPQYCPPAELHVPLVQLLLPHTLGTPAAPHEEPAGQSPQSVCPPQPLPTMPQYCPPVAGAQTVAVQSPELVGAPHTLERPPPPQVKPPPQDGHMSWRPHPSPMLPQ